MTTEMCMDGQKYKHSHERNRWMNGKKVETNGISVDGYPSYRHFHNWRLSAVLLTSKACRNELATWPLTLSIYRLYLFYYSIW
jgi:hypothetical protein